jgi:hypothetical protein
MTSTFVHHTKQWFSDAAPWALYLYCFYGLFLFFYFYSSYYRFFILYYYYYNFFFFSGIFQDLLSCYSFYRYQPFDQAFFLSVRQPFIIVVTQKVKKKAFTVRYQLKKTKQILAICTITLCGQHSNSSFHHPGIIQLYIILQHAGWRTLREFSDLRDFCFT